ncbi:putative reverse transcriptase, partial [Trifolium medium]|nr:putative reverse transcriptase [Trifolium medium]
MDTAQEDKLIWVDDMHGCYTVKSGYKFVLQSLARSDILQVEGEWNAIWRAAAPHKMCLLLWRLCRGCVPTRIRLLQRRVNCPSICPVRDQEEDSATVGRVAALMWCIWQNRNDTMWNNVRQTSSQIGKWSFEVWQDWYAANQNCETDDSPRAVQAGVCWEKPHEGWLKCKTLVFSRKMVCQRLLIALEIIWVSLELQQLPGSNLVSL